MVVEVPDIVQQGGLQCVWSEKTYSLIFSGACVPVYLVLLCAGVGLCTSCDRTFSLLHVDLTAILKLYTLLRSFQCLWVYRWNTTAFSPKVFHYHVNCHQGTYVGMQCTKFYVFERWDRNLAVCVHSGLCFNKIYESWSNNCYHIRLMVWT